MVNVDLSAPPVLEVDVTSAPIVDIALVISPVVEVTIDKTGPQGAVGPQGPDGLRGDIGPEGPAGVAGGFFEYNTLVPSATWEITHNLGKHPSVTVVDSANTVVIGDVEYISDDELVITFVGSFSGSAYLN